MKLKTTLLSLAAILSMSTTATATNQPPVHLLIDASGSVSGTAEVFIDEVMRAVDPPAGMDYFISRWDENLLPSTLGQSWPTEDDFFIKRIQRHAGTELGPSLGSLLHQTRQSNESCTRIVVVVHGMTHNWHVLRNELSQVRQTEFIRILMQPFDTGENDVDTDLAYYQQLAAAAPAGDVAAAKFTPENFAVALQDASMHQCRPAYT